MPYTNTGLAETLTVGMTLSLPDHLTKVVATDAMYYMDSLSMLTEATTSVRNLLVLAGRSWGAWGGAHNATNLLGLLLHTRVYEPVTAAEFQACLDRLARDPATTHVASMIDAAFEPPARDCSADIDGGVWLTPPGEGPDAVDATVVTFGYAGVLVEAANRDVGLPHLHCAALDPRLDPAGPRRPRTLAPHPERRVQRSGQRLRGAPARPAPAARRSARRPPGHRHPRAQAPAAAARHEPRSAARTARRAAGEPGGVRPCACIRMTTGRRGPTASSTARSSCTARCPASSPGAAPSPCTT